MKQALWAVSALHRGHTATNCPDIAPHPEGHYADFRPRPRSRAPGSPGCYPGPIGSASVSSMRYSGRRVAAGASLILATLPLKQPPLAITSESVLMLPRTWPVAAISTLPVAVMLPA